MKKLLAGLLGLALTGAIAPCASAADIYQPTGPGGYKDAPYIPLSTWTGFYFGANGGYGWDAAGSKNLDVNIADLTTFTAGKTSQPEGGFGGAQIGYNWQRDHIVFGVESDIQISDMRGDKTSVTPILERLSFSSLDKREIDWFGTVRGRLGYAWDTTLLYFTGGFAFGKVNETAIGSLSVANLGTLELGRVSKSDIQTGYVLGGGVEFKPWGLLSSPNWTVKVEYQYINLGSERLTGSAIAGLFPLSTNAHDDEFHTVRLGLNYHIPAGYEPLK